MRWGEKPTTRRRQRRTNEERKKKMWNLSSQSRSDYQQSKTIIPTSNTSQTKPDTYNLLIYQTDLDLVSHVHRDGWKVLWEQFHVMHVSHFPVDVQREMSLNSAVLSSSPRRHAITRDSSYYQLLPCKSRHTEDSVELATWEGQGKRRDCVAISGRT